MDHIHPAPVFEGSEKRVEFDFVLGQGAPASGLRSLPRAQLDELMTLAACTIVSSRSNADFDAYVLSESSLFVYPTKWVLKTCGTTRLLHSVPRLLELAAAAGLVPARCKYNRASFLFPEQQVCACEIGGVIWAVQGMAAEDSVEESIDVKRCDQPEARAGKPDGK